MVPAPGRRVELRAAVRQPRGRAGAVADAAVRPKRRLERIRRSAAAGLPLPVCRNVRAGRDKRFAGEAAWSFCAAKNEMYYGFKAGMLMNSRDEIYRVWLGPANVDEREVLAGLATGMAGAQVADKGGVSPPPASTLAGRGRPPGATPQRDKRQTPPPWG